MLHSYVHRLSWYLLVTWIQSGTAVHSRCFLNGEVLFLPFGWYTYSGERQCASCRNQEHQNAGILSLSCRTVANLTLGYCIPQRDTSHRCLCVCVCGGGGAGGSFQIEDYITPTITWLRSCISQTVYVLFQIPRKENCWEKAACYPRKRLIKLMILLRRERIQKMVNMSNWFRKSVWCTLDYPGADYPVYAL